LWQSQRRFGSVEGGAQEAKKMPRVGFIGEKEQKEAQGRG
jgi:hypothetical protein